MITLCARNMRKRTTAALGPPGQPRSYAAPTDPPGGEFFGTYLAQLPDLVALCPLDSGGPDRVFSRPGWSPGVLLLAAGRFLRPRRLHRRCSAPLPYVAGPGSRTGLDLRFLVAGPGFEPGKTVVGDFTDRGRYCPDLAERQGNALFWHAFDMPRSTCGGAWHSATRASTYHSTSRARRLITQ
jgi:hypothetical protein